MGAEVTNLKLSGKKVRTTLKSKWSLSGLLSRCIKLKNQIYM